MNARTKLGMRIGVPAVILVVGLIIAMLTMGINDAGQRTVIQIPSGQLIVKFNPGVYFSLFGKTTKYNDLLTFDFDRSAAEGGKATLDQPGINVRYQDGGMGSIYGKGRFALPNDESTMLELHKAFRSNDGLANKLIKPVTEEAMNLTAGLMNSEEAYATKRAIFIQWAKSQINHGKFQTVLDTVDTKDEVTGKIVYKEIPVIAVDKNKIPIHIDSDLKKYGISLVGFQLNDPGFEKSTMKQIAEKRAATMAIITAKANAEKAKQMAITAEEDGKAAVMEAKYLEEVQKAKMLVIASRTREVAIIAATQKVEVAEQDKLEAEQIKLRAEQIKLANILEGEGLAEKKRLIMQADGALEQKLDAYKSVMKTAFSEFSKQKWVPEVMMGGSNDSTGGNEAANLINLMTANTLKQLGLDLKMDTGTNTVQYIK